MDNPCEAAIFDLDGLLLDTEPLYESAYAQICARYGKVYSLEVRVNVGQIKCLKTNLFRKKDNWQGRIIRCDTYHSISPVAVDSRGIVKRKRYIIGGTLSDSSSNFFIKLKNPK